MLCVCSGYWIWDQFTSDKACKSNPCWVCVDSILTSPLMSCDRQGLIPDPLCWKWRWNVQPEKSVCHKTMDLGLVGNKPERSLKWLGLIPDPLDTDQYKSYTMSMDQELIIKHQASSIRRAQRAFFSKASSPPPIVFFIYL